MHSKSGDNVCLLSRSWLRWIRRAIVLLTSAGIVGMTGMVGCTARATQATQDAHLGELGTATPGTAITTQSSMTPTASAESDRFSGNVAMQHVAAQLAFGPRPAGSDALGHTRQYILDNLDKVGWSTEVQDFSYRGILGHNIIGRKAGSSGSVLILGAHYDTRKYADQDLKFPKSPVPGANDGASGVAVLLELARVLRTSRVKGDVWLVFFDAEDDGQIDGWDWIVGSTVFAQRLQVKPDYVIIVDMVGDRNLNIYMDANSDPTLSQHLWKTGESLGLGSFFIPKIKYAMLDDHTPFINHGIPAVDIIDFDYPYWHTTQDTIDKISPDSLEHVGSVLQLFLESGGEYPTSN